MLLEEHAGVLELDVYRGFSSLPSLVDDENWPIERGLGMCDARDNVCTAGDIPWLVHGVVKIEDVREIDVVEGWCSVDREKVRIVELLPLDDGTLTRMVEDLEAATTEINQREAELQELREEVDELRQDEEDGDAVD
jgi:hypothetical protein